MLVVVVTIIGEFNCDAQLLQRSRFRRLNKPSGLKLKQRLQEKLNQYRQRTIQTICYGKFLEIITHCYPL